MKWLGFLPLCPRYIVGIATNFCENCETNSLSEKVLMAEATRKFPARLVDGWIVPSEIQRKSFTTDNSMIIGWESEGTPNTFTTNTQSTLRSGLQIGRPMSVMI